MTLTGPPIIAVVEPINKIDNIQTITNTHSTFHNSKPILDIKKYQLKSKQEKKPIEPNIKVAGNLFLIYYLINIIAIFILIGVIIGSIIIDPLLGLILLYIAGIVSYILLIISFVLAIIGLSKIRKSKGKYSGTVLAIIIIIWFTILVVFPLLSELFLII